MVAIIRMQAARTINAISTLTVMSVMSTTRRADSHRNPVVVSPEPVCVQFTGVILRQRLLNLTLKAAFSGDEQLAGFNE
jgi:hypothetical protein